MKRISPAIFRFLAISAIALSVPLSALAQQGPADSHGRDARPGEPVAEHMLRGLDLSDAQRTQIKSITDARREQIRTSMQSVRELRQALHALALSDKFDEVAVAAKSQELGRVEGDMAREMAQSMQKIYAVLTPQQRAKLQQQLDQRGKGPRRHGPRH